MWPRNHKKIKQYGDKIMQNGLFPSLIFLSSCDVPLCLLQPCLEFKQQTSAAWLSVLLLLCHINGIACVNGKTTPPPRPWLVHARRHMLSWCFTFFDHPTWREVVCVFSFNVVFKKKRHCHLLVQQNKLFLCRLCCAHHASVIKQYIKLVCGIMIFNNTWSIHTP